MPVGEAVGVWSGPTAGALPVGAAVPADLVDPEAVGCRSPNTAATSGATVVEE